MALTQQTKKDLIEKYKKGNADTGSPEVQIALFTERINYLTEHFKTHTKDHHSRHGLMTIVNKRRRLLDYLKKNNPERYQQIIQDLRIRK